MAPQTPHPHMSTAIAIFVKTPGLSPIKTRLAADIGSTEAIRFHRLAAAATAEVISACGPLLTPYWAVAEEAAFADETWLGFPRIWQGPGSLGQRLHRIHAQLLNRHDSALLIGADTPQLTPALLQRSTAMLREPETSYVMGPANDGGFWLFGSKRPVPATTWRAVPYSRHDTADVLRHALRDTGRLETLPLLADVDNARDVPALYEALLHLSMPTTTQIELIDWAGKIDSGSA